jgi:hypothetical protein
MATAVRLTVLAAAFGVASWAGYALARPSPGNGAAPPAAPVVVAGAPIAGPAVPAAPRGDLDGPRAPAPSAVPVPAKTKAKEAGKYVRVTFSDLSQWDLDPKDVQVPGSILALAGKDLDVVGYMIPYGNPDAVEEFVLVKDMGSCCFGQAPLPHHLIECKFEPGRKMAYVPGPVRARGRFRVEEHRQGQYLVSVYAMTVADCVEVR